MTWTKELEQKLVKLVEIHGNDYHTVARELHEDASYHAVRIKYRRLRDTYQAESISEIHSNAVLDGKLFDEKDVLELAGYDPEQWRISKVTDNAWGQPMGDRLQNTQFKLQVVPKEQLLTFDDMVERAQAIKPRLIEMDYTDITEQYLLIPLYDYHFGLNSLSDYSELQSSIADIIINGYAEILFVLGGDYYHTDNFINTTEAGTRIDDIDPQTAIDDGLQFIMPLIELALQHSPCVKLLYTTGNHAPSQDYMLSIILDREFEDLEVDNAIEEYKHAWLGNHSIFVHHGNNRKTTASLLDVIVTKYAKQWGDSASRYLFTGHFHHERSLSTAGLTHYQVQSPSKASSYDKRKGFITSETGAMLFEFNKQKRSAIHYL